MAIGFSLDRLAALGLLSGDAGPLERLGHAYGLFAVGAGMAMAPVALVRFLRARARIEGDRLESRPAADLVLMVLIAAGGLALLVLVGTAR